jgi:hypothetical protein
MRSLKFAFSAILVLLLLTDAVVVYRIRIYGWPQNITLTGVGGIEHVRVSPVKFTSIDCLWMLMIVVVHVLFIYLVWRSWRPSPIR